MDRLTFVPRSDELFLYEDPDRGARSAGAACLNERLRRAGWPASALIVPLHQGREAGRTVRGFLIELFDALPILADPEADPGADPGADLGPDLGAWAAAARLGLDLVRRGSAVARLVARHDLHDGRVSGWDARWSAVLAGPRDREAMRALAARLSPPEVALPAGHHGPGDEAGALPLGAPGLVRAMLDACADALVREASWRGAVVRLGGWPADAWEQRLVRALSDVRPTFAAEPATADLAAEVNAWSKDQLLSPSLLPSSPSWGAPEPLQHVVRRLLAPAALLADRLVERHEAPRTLAAG